MVSKLVRHHFCEFCNTVCVFLFLSTQQDTQGRLLISLTFNPVSGTLDGTVFEANNLTKQDVFGLAG